MGIVSSSGQIWEFMGVGAQRGPAVGGLVFGPAMAPASVLVAWALGQPLSLDFHPLALAILLLSVFTVLSVILDGKANWLEGFMLMLTYCLVAVLCFTGTPLGGTTEA